MRIIFISVFIQPLEAKLWKCHYANDQVTTCSIDRKYLNKRFQNYTLQKNAFSGFSDYILAVSKIRSATNHLRSILFQPGVSNTIKESLKRADGPSKLTNCAVIDEATKDL